MSADFALSERELDSDRHVIALRGEVDISTAPQLERRLLAAIDRGVRTIVVDFTETVFIDSTGLCVLLATQRRLNPVGGELVFVCTAPTVRRLFHITGMDDLFRVHATREEALAADPEPDGAARRALERA
jgi:anti-sigma B factor antagonist